MGMDGLSMANTGMLREATSRDYAVQTEEAIAKDDQNKQVDKLQTQMRVKEDGRNSSGGTAEEEENEEDNKNDDEAGVYTPSDETEEQEDENRLEISKEDLDNHTFYVKITKDGDVFELYDKETDRLVEKISAQEVNQLLSKLNMASGILVNKAV